jgi:hypothetical protein
MQNTQEIKAARKRAEDRFKAQEAQKADAPRAVAGYYATQQAAVDRISSLREQRLALERDRRVPTAPGDNGRQPLRSLTRATAVE